MPNATVLYNTEAMGAETVRVNWASHVPRFEQVKQIIRQFISENGLKPGDPLPSEREWARRLKVSQMTINRALKNLSAKVSSPVWSVGGLLSSTLLPVLPLPYDIF